MLSGYFASHTANIKLQTGVPDTKINPKGIGEMNEYFQWFTGVWWFLEHCG